MNRTQFAARNKRNTNVAGGTKSKSKAYFECSCPDCGCRNKCNANQKKIVCSRITCNCIY